jgi:hypothetical protein
VELLSRNVAGRSDLVRLVERTLHANPGSVQHVRVNHPRKTRSRGCRFVRQIISELRFEKSTAGAAFQISLATNSISLV